MDSMKPVLIDELAYFAQPFAPDTDPATAIIAQSDPKILEEVIIATKQRGSDIQAQMDEALRSYYIATQAANLLYYQEEIALQTTKAAFDEIAAETHLDFPATDSITTPQHDTLTHDPLFDIADARALDAADALVVAEMEFDIHKPGQELTKAIEQHREEYGRWGRRRSKLAGFIVGMAAGSGVAFATLPHEGAESGTAVGIGLIAGIAGFLGSDERSIIAQNRSARRVAQQKIFVAKQR